MKGDALNGRAIVIIGGTTGIGLSAALACQCAGARVVCVGRDDDTLQAAHVALGSQAVVIGADATKTNTAAEAIRIAQEKFGRFDGLYHVAGGSGRRHGDGPLHELSDEGWQYTLEQNLSSVMYSNRAAVQAFMASGAGGSIVNVGSVLAFSPAPAYFSTHAYAAAKAAIVGMMRSCAAYYAKHNIRMNVIAAGLVNTPMAQRAAQSQTIQEYIHTKQPLDGGRIGIPADLDGAAVFLLSDQSRFITGQVVNVDGGWSVSDGQVTAE